MTDTRTGRPVLAWMSAAQIPAVSARTALDGLLAGFMAAVTYAGHHTDAGALRFNLALTDARKGHDYDYSREFAVGLELAKQALADLNGGAS